MTQTTAIFIGANSQLSHEIIKQLSATDIHLALLVSDPDSLKPLTASLGRKISVYKIDIYQPEAAISQLQQVWQELSGAELILVNTGANQYDASLPWIIDKNLIDVNVTGFSALCNCAFNLFKEQGYGQLAAITSIAGLRGGASVAYHASKAFEQNYLQGLSMHAQRLKLPITITDIKLGMLDKAALQASRLWLVSLPKLAQQIVKAIKAGKRDVCLPKRWKIIAILTKILPEYIYNTRRWR